MKKTFVCLISIMFGLGLFISSLALAEERAWFRVSPTTIFASAYEPVTIKIDMQDFYTVYDVVVDWGDGKNTKIRWDNGITTLTHVYEQSGNYAITVSKKNKGLAGSGTVDMRTARAEISNVGPDKLQTGDLNPLKCQTFGECFDAITNFTLYLSIGILSLSIIVAGIIFFTGGTPDRIALAKKIVLWAIGIFIIMIVFKIIANVTQKDLTNLHNIKQAP